MKHWNDMTAGERIDRVRTLDAQGVERADQASRLGIGGMTLSRFCSEHGVAANDNFARSRWAGMNGHRRRAEVTAMRAANMPVAAIAAELGISKTTLQRFLKANGMVVERVIVIGGPPMEPATPVDPATFNALPGTNWPVTLLELEPGMCKWPVDDVPDATEQYFCGCASGRHSYCETHAHVARFGSLTK